MPEGKEQQQQERPSVTINELQKETGYLQSLIDRNLMVLTQYQEAIAKQEEINKLTAKNQQLTTELEELKANKAKGKKKK